MSPRMSAAKSILAFMLIGAVLGVVVASFVVPPALAWYNQTGKIAGERPVETLCNVPELIRYATTRLLEGQLVGAGVGAGLFGLLGAILRMRRRDAIAPPA